MNEVKLAKRLLDLQKLLLQFLEIERMIYLPDGAIKNRRETDTEHSFHLAMLAWYLCSAYPHLDRDKVIRYSLAHDLVEIYAGDIMAVGRTEEQQIEKEKREKSALKKLKANWPDFGDMTNTIEEYEKQDNPEAVFVKALDKILPMILNILGEGKTWKIYDIKRSTVIKLKDDKTKHSKEISEIWKVLRAEIMSRDDFFNPGKTD